MRAKHNININFKFNLKIIKIWQRLQLQENNLFAINIFTANNINVRNRSIRLHYDELLRTFEVCSLFLEKDCFPFVIFILFFSISFSVSDYYSIMIPLSLVRGDYWNLLFRMSNIHKCLLLDINSHFNSLVNQNLKYAYLHVCAVKNIVRLHPSILVYYLQFKVLYHHPSVFASFESLSHA